MWTCTIANIRRLQSDCSFTVTFICAWVQKNCVLLVRTLHTIRMCGKHTSRNINGKVTSHAMDNFCILAVRVHVLQVPRPSSPPCKGLVCVTINDTNYTQHLVLVYMYIYTAIICILRYNASVHFCKRWNSCCGVPHMHTYYHIHTFTSLSPPLFPPPTHMHEYSHIQCKCTCVHTLCYSGDHNILKLCASYMYGGGI